MTAHPSVNPADPTTVPKFRDPLLIPPTIRPDFVRKGMPHFTVRMVEVKRRLHSAFPKTTLWTYNGLYPGPTFDVRSEEPIVVRYLNCLPGKHLLPVDRTIDGCGKVPAVRNVVHLHGGHVPAYADGHPEAWFSPCKEEVGPAYRTNIYRYPNKQGAGTLWYHDHALGITRLNVYAGLAGLYLIRDEVEDQLQIPKGAPYEVPLVIQDRSFGPDGSLDYPAPCIAGVCPSIVPEFFGNTILVNGRVWPYLAVEPRYYRFRVLNGSNARRYELRLSNGKPLIQIGTEGGFVREPMAQDRITVWPGERVDVLIDFAGLEDETITLLNTAPDADPDTTGQLLQFRVTKRLQGPETTEVPTEIPGFTPLDPTTATTLRVITLTEQLDQFGRPMPLLEGLRWDDPVTVAVRLGSTEVWELLNLTEDDHPIHLHLVQFQLLGRQAFDVDLFKESGRIEYTADPVGPGPDEFGWKDTLHAPPGYATRIIMRFEDFPGCFPFHCHILEHEDHEMMRQFWTVEPS